MLEASGLVDFYKTDREGKDRLENLEELVNAAEASSPRKASARTRSRCRSTRPARATASPAIAGEAGQRRSRRPAPRSCTSGEIVAPPRLVPDAETGEIMSPLAAFLTHASLEAGDNQAQAGQDAVQLMTIHSAKGLEFDCVFISGLEEGLFPHENSSSDLDGLEEERRLMYVAITRAQEAPLPELLADADAARPDPLQRQEPLPRRAARGGAALDHAAQPGLRLGLRPPVQRGLVARLGPALDRRHRPGRPAFGAAPIAARRRRRTACAPGQGVFHTKFGEGVVITLEGSGEDARAQVNFGRHGMKWLALSVAKLTPVD